MIKSLNSTLSRAITCFLGRPTNICASVLEIAFAASRNLQQNQRPFYTGKGTKCSKDANTTTLCIDTGVHISKTYHHRTAPNSSSRNGRLVSERKTCGQWTVPSRQGHVDFVHTILSRQALHMHPAEHEQVFVQQPQPQTSWPQGQVPAHR